MKYFGTDGIRGIWGETLSAEFAEKVGFAYGIALKNQANSGAVIQNSCRRVIVGRDTRASGSTIETAICRGLTQAGFDVVCAGILPTPALSFSAKSGDFVGGVMITASHNPSNHNGIKLCNSAGKKHLPDFLETVEKFIETGRTADFVADRIGTISHENDIGVRWVEFVLRSQNFPNFAGLKVALDLANGAGYELIPLAFRRAGAEVLAFNTENDGKNINNDCGSTHLNRFLRSVVEVGADVGFAFDGDADRIIAVTRTGQVVDGTDLMYIFGKYYAEKNLLTGDAVVTTPITNMGLEISLNAQGIRLVRTEKVGGQYIEALMEERDFVIGGEENGHMLLNNIGVGSDGLCVGVGLLKIMREKGCDLPDLLAGLKRKNLAQQNISVTEPQKQKVASGCLVDFLAEQKLRLSPTDRIIVRPSGTECLIRVLVEGDDQRILDEVCLTISNHIANL